MAGWVDAFLAPLNQGVSGGFYSEVIVSVGVGSSGRVLPWWDKVLVKLYVSFVLGPWGKKASIVGIRLPMVKGIDGRAG